MKNSISLSFLLFTCFLVVGYTVSSVFSHPFSTSNLNPTSLTITSRSNSKQTMNNGQQSILVIGVDSLETAEPELSGLWLISFLPSDPTLHIFPIFPTSAQTLTGQEYKLYRYFDLANTDDDLTLDQTFTDLLEKNNYWWSGYIIVDETAVVKMINILNEKGYGLNNQSIQEMPRTIDDPQTAFSKQLSVIQTVCQNFSRLTNKSIKSEILSLSPHHLITDLDLREFTIEWEATFSNEHNSTCRFPTLQVNAVDQ